MAQEEGTSQALKEEGMRRENALQQLRAAVKEVRGCWECPGVVLNEQSFSKALNLVRSSISPASCCQLSCQGCERSCALLESRRSRLCLRSLMGMGWRRPSSPAGGSRTGVQTQPWLQGRAKPSPGGIAGVHKPLEAFRQGQSSSMGHFPFDPIPMWG